MTTENRLEDAAFAASQNQEALGAEVEQDTVKLSFVGAQGWLRDVPKLGEAVEFTIRGYVRSTGQVALEGEEGVRDFVQVKITGLERTV